MTLTETEIRKVLNHVVENPNFEDLAEHDDSIPAGKVRYCKSVPLIPDFPLDGVLDGMIYTVSNDHTQTYIEVIK